MRLCLLFMCLWAYDGLAQALSFQAIDKTRGLPSNTIYDLLQDQRGFIWLATDKGLYRYDGVHFRPYNNARQVDKGLSNLMIDRQGRVWCQNFTGQFFFVSADSLHLCSALPPTGAYYPAAIIGGETLMSVGRTGIRRLDLTRFRLAETPMSVVQLRPYAHVHNGYYYLPDATTTNLIGTNAAGQQQTIPTTANHTTFFHAVVDKTLLLIAKNEVTSVTARRPDGTGYTIRLSQEALVQNATTIGDRYLVLFTTAGFYLIDVRRGDRSATPQLINKNCTSMIRDSEGNFWLATIDAGLLLIPSLSVDVLAAGRPFVALQRVSTPRTESLFYGTADGELGYVELPRRRWQTLHQSPARGPVLSLFHDPIRQQTLFCTDQFYRWRRGRVDKLEVMSVKDMEAIDGRYLALAATGTLARLDLSAASPTFTRLGNAGDRVRAVAIRPGTSTLYAATSTGLWAYAPGHSPRQITDRHTSLSVADLTFSEGQEPHLFAASSVQGVYELDSQNRVVRHLTTANGLTDNSVYRIRAYKNQVWWLTEKAVQAYDLRTRQVRTYDKTDGLPDTDLYDLAFIQDTVYVATLAGLVRFPAQMPATDRHPPRVLITALLQNRDIVKRQPGDVRFRHDQNTITIQYSVLSFRGQEAVHVYYRVKQQAWVRADNTQRMINLPSLAPDTYTVEVRAINADGVVNQIPAIITFTIDRPLWLQHWFLALLGLHLALLVYLIYRNRLARLARETRLHAERNVLAQELQQSRLTAIKSQMNPHFIFNALNTIQSYIYLNEKQQASTYLVKFSELTRMILDMSNGDTVSLAEELKAIGLYLELERMRFEDTLTYELIVDETLDEERVRIPSMLIQPYVENAIKHGLMHKKSDRRLLVSFEKRAGYLEICIDDNGVGRTRSKEINQHRARRHESFASAANQRRLDLLNDGPTQQISLEIIDKTDKAGQAAGTAVLLRIPLHYL